MVVKDFLGKDDYKLISVDNFIIKDTSIIIYEHIFSKIRVCLAINKDSHLQGSISFNTPPSDDTGIPHIIEHLVFNGSKKYPVKDMMQEVSKNIYHSMLNAFTYQNLTSYVFSSFDMTSFYSIFDLYLDALFNPLFPENIHAFHKEGFNLKYHKGKFTVGGVVYNEMSSVFTSSEEVLNYHVNKLLIPDYFESGGIPAAMIDLSFDEIKEYYRKYYKTDNCVIYLYGAIKTEEVLAKISSFISENALKGRAKENSKIPKKTVDESKLYFEPTYTLQKNEGILCTISYKLSLIKSFQDKMLYLMIKDLLSYSKSTFFRKEIEKLNLAKSFNVELDLEASNPIISFIFRKVNLRKLKVKVKDSGSKETAERISYYLSEKIKAVIKNFLDKEISPKDVNIHYENLLLSEMNLDHDGFFGLNLLNHFLFPLTKRESIKPFFPVKMQSSSTIEYAKFLAMECRKQLSNLLLTNNQVSVILTPGGKNKFQLNLKATNLNLISRTLYYQTLERDYSSLDDLVSISSFPYRAEPEVFSKELNLNTTLYYNQVDNSPLAAFSLFVDISCLSAEEIIFLEIYLKCLGKFPLLKKSHKKLSMESLKLFEEFCLETESLPKLGSAEFQGAVFLVLKIKSAQKMSKKATKLALDILTKTKFSSKKKLLLLLNTILHNYQSSLKENAIYLLEKIQINNFFNNEFTNKDLSSQNQIMIIRLLKRIIIELKTGNLDLFTQKAEFIIKKIFSISQSKFCAISGNQLKSCLDLKELFTEKFSAKSIEQEKEQRDFRKAIIKNCCYVTSFESNHLVCGFKFTKSILNPGESKILKSFLENNVLFKFFREDLELYSFWCHLSLHGYFMIAAESFAEFDSLYEELQKFFAQVLNEINSLTPKILNSLKISVLSEIDYPLSDLNISEDYLYSKLTNTSADFKYNERENIQNITITRLKKITKEIFSSNRNFNYFVMMSTEDAKNCEYRSIFSEITKV